jgi:hypothetical protein
MATAHVITDQYSSTYCSAATRFAARTFLALANARRRRSSSSDRPPCAWAWTRLLPTASGRSPWAVQAAPDTALKLP